MSDEYQKMSELLDNWLSDNEKNARFALIEKEILLEKLRRLYVQVAAVGTEEYEAAKPNPTSAEVASEPKREFTPAKTLEEDVDLFFDTEHESYKAVEEELKNIAEEIGETQGKPGTPNPKTVTGDSEPDIFDQIEEDEPAAAEDSPLTDDAEELFIEPDFEITAQPENAAENGEPDIEEEDSHEEDDILQFAASRKNVPAQPEAPAAAPGKPAEPENAQPRPAAEEPAPKQEARELLPDREQPQQKPQQRSLNDLFNERREDHSISSQYQRAKVGDLTKAISINDKFIYIKELFHNRGEDFSAAIRQLNDCKNMEEAFDCLEGLKQKYFWDSKSDAYLSFCDLLRRKYS